MLLKELRGGNGTYVAVLPNLATRMLLQEWALGQGLPIVNDLHVTVLYSRNPIIVTPRVFDYQAIATGFEIFDDGCLVLKLQSEALTNRHNDLIRAGGTHDYPRFNPHVTLVKGKCEISDLKLPNFALTFGDEYTEELDD